MKTVFNTKIHKVMKNYSKYICAFVLLLGMSVSAWGAITVDSNPTESGDYTITCAKATGSSAPWDAGDYIRCYANNTITITTSGSANMSRIDIAWTKNPSKDFADVTADCGEYSHPDGEGTGTWEGSAKTVVFTVGSSGQIQITEVTITAADPYTVTFNKQGGTFDDPAFDSDNTLTEASGGAGVTLPLVNPSVSCALEGWGFYGWATSAVGSSTTTAPNIVGKAGDTYHPSDDITLHAVFAQGEYTKETSSITTGGKYLIVANSGGHNYVMTNNYSTFISSGDEYGQLDGKLIDETTTNKYSAASVNAAHVFTIVTASSLSVGTGDWMIKNEKDNKYVSVDYQEMYLGLDEMSEGSDGNYIRVTSGTWKITNYYESEANKLYFDSSDKVFKKDGSTASELLLYEAGTINYWSTPSCCDKIVELSEGTKSNVSSIAFSLDEVPTCSSTAANRQVTVAVTTNTGYKMVGDLGFAKTGTVTATKNSGPTGSGPYTYVYEFNQNDNGTGTFSATATAKTYTVTLNGNGATSAGSPATVTATYNSNSLSTSITNPSKTGYTFAGWNTKSDGTGYDVISTSGTLNASKSGYTDASSNWIKDADVELYAKWTINKYKVTLASPTTVTISATSPSIAEGAYAEVNYGSAVTLSYSSLVEGRQWSGWKVTKDVDGSNVTASVVSTNTLTVPAYDVTVNAEVYGGFAFSCAELTLTPKLVTAGTPIFITSAASKKVRSQDSILIVGNGLTPSTSVTFPGLPSQFEVKSRLGGNFTTKADGTIDTVAYIFYTPDAGDTSDGLDKLVGITASVGGAKPKADTLKYDIIGRHLPNKIVIAAKGSDNKWYALPSYMQNASSYNVSPQEISVDNVTLPTKAYSSSTNRYNGIEGPTLTGAGNNLASGNSQYVRLLMDIHVDSLDSSTPYAPLFGQSGDGTKVGRSGKANPTNNLSAGWWWLLTQTNTSITNPQDAKYQIKCANNAKLLRLWEAAGGAGNPKWGLYANGINELRLIPMEDGVEFAEAYMIEWGQHGAIVEVDAGGIFATKVSATIGDGEESAKIALSQTLTSVSSYSTKYNYTVNFGDGIDFAADESNGAQLTLKWYDSYDDLRGVSNIIIPKIIASTNATMSTIESDKDFWNTEVHVLPGDTLFADAGSFASSRVTIKDLQIYPGATVKVTSGTLNVTNLSLRNGWTRVGSKRYDAARLQIKSTANLTHTNAYVDLYIDNDQFYPLAVPFPVTVSNIKYVYSSRSFSVGGMSGEVRLRYYDGASRAAGKSGNWKYYGAEGVDVPTTLLPSMGYAIAVKRPSGKAFSVLRLPLTFDNAWTTGGEKGHYTDGSSVTHYKDTVRVFAYGKNAEILECNKGWNLIGNPYMAVFHGDNSEGGIYGKILAVTNKDDEKGEKVRYITIPNSSFTDYTQVNFKDGSLNPGSSFLIQAKDTSRLEFSNAKIDVPSAPARYTATPKAAPEQEAYIRLSHEGGYDQMGLIIGEDYTAAYETNADLMKMLGELNTLKTYMIYDSVEMAYLAINEDLAKEWIPVTVRIPESGEYTYSLTGTSEIEELEGIYLIDYQSNTVTNLIEENYSFTIEAGTISERFAINAIYGHRDTPTDIDIINAGGDINSKKPVKFIWNDKVYILHNGVIYDSTGKKVREINK